MIDDKCLSCEFYRTDGDYNEVCANAFCHDHSEYAYEPGFDVEELPQFLRRQV